MPNGLGARSFLGLFLFKDVISLGVSINLISYFGQKAILSENLGARPEISPIRDECFS
jgi:hypothetical protein